MAKKKRTTIPGVSFSWKRALGITKMKREFTKATGIPTTKAGVERKLGSMLLGLFFGDKKKSNDKDDNEKVY